MTPPSTTADTGPSLHGIVAAASSDTGRVRDHNEDAFALLDDIDTYVVSDGMGGEAGGETASRIVVTALPELLRADPAAVTAPERTGEQVVRSTRREALREALLHVSELVRRQAEERIGLEGMGATVVVAAVDDQQVTVAHLGDSRAYRFRDGHLVALTEDHSVVGLLLRRGEITPDEAAVHPARGRITRYAGMPERVAPDVCETDLRAGDRLLLCSDGLTGEVPDPTIAAILGGTVGDPRAACDGLVEAALDAGGSDNVTVVVADVGEE